MDIIAYAGIIIGIIGTIEFLYGLWIVRNEDDTDRI